MGCETLCEDGGMRVWVFIALVGGTILGVCTFLGIRFGVMGAVIGALCCVSIGFFSSLSVLLSRWSERVGRRSGR